jgi:uncharacterized protein YcbK (DUF882 family)
MGDGTLTLRNSHNGERASLRYRRDDGSYDGAALAKIRRLFRSRSDQKEHDISLRLVEILSMLQKRAAAKELVLNSGYRTPELNEELRKQGKRAASGSLHTEGLAADVAIPGAHLRRLWDEIRALECCGTGLYEHDGFLHMDVGAPRFWEPETSGVEKNLSAENARVFARTEFDRYAGDEAIGVRVHSITLPPIAIARAARLVPEHGDAVEVKVDAAAEAKASVPAPREPGLRPVDPRAGEASSVVSAPEAPNCIEVEPGVLLRITGARPSGRARIELRTCAPRPGRTPEIIASNPMEIR